MPENGENKIPDLLLRKSDWLILDYKEIKGKSKETLGHHISELDKYHQKFTYSGNTFEPDVAIISTSLIANVFKDNVDTLPVLGCLLGKTIRLKHVAGKFRSTEISDVFGAQFSVSVSNIYSKNLET